LGVLDNIHQAVFDAMHLKRQKMERIEEIKALFVKNGVNGSTFDQAFKSFGVTTQVKKALATARSYGVEGTPEIIVDGKYRISMKMAGSHANMLAIADHLIAKIRTEKSASGN